MGEPAQRKMKKHLIIPDTHTPFEDKAAVSAVLKYAADYKPDVIVHIGDVGDFESVSHWMEDKRLKLEGLRIKHDIDSALGLLTRLKNAAPKAELIITMGNHDDWVHQYVEAHAELEGFLDLEAEYKKAGWKVVEINKPYQIGKLLLFHGMFTNEHHAKSTVHALASHVCTATRTRRNFILNPFMMARSRRRVSAAYAK